MTNLNSILKSRDITLLTKVRIVKAVVFPAVMYRSESWDHKEGWEPKNCCFWIVVLEKTLEVPWTARRSNQSILKEINLEYSLEGLMLKLKLQYFGHPMRRANSLEDSNESSKDPKTEGRWRRGNKRMRWLEGISGSLDMYSTNGRQWWTGKPGVLQFMGLQSVGQNLATEQP